MRFGVIWVGMFLLFLASCSEDGLVSPDSDDSVVANLTRIDSAVDASLEIQNEIPVRGGSVNTGIKTRRYFNVLMHVKFGRTRASARLVDHAAQAFAADNDGWFPGNVVDRNTMGRTLISYLPAGKMLKNAYSQIADLPHGGMAHNPGDVAYEAINVDGYSAGYVVSAQGNSRDQTYTIVRYPD